LEPKSTVLFIISRSSPPPPPPPPSLPLLVQASKQYLFFLFSYLQLTSTPEEKAKYKEKMNRQTEEIRRKIDFEVQIDPCNFLFPFSIVILTTLLFHYREILMNPREEKLLLRILTSSLSHTLMKMTALRMGFTLPGFHSLSFLKSKKLSKYKIF